MQKMKLLFGLLGLVVLSSVSAADLTQPIDFIYKIKSGDTLSLLSKKILDTPTRWRDVLTYNHIANPNQIKPGQSLRIRPLWLKSQAANATVEALSGQVSANGRSVNLGGQLAQGEVVQTAAASNVRIRLPDGSIVNVQPNSQIQLETLQQNQANVFKTVLNLLQGQIETFKKKYALGQSELSVRGRTATIGVRGTHFRMRQTSDSNFAEIEEGLVSFEALKSPAPLALGGGFGSVADGQHPVEAIALLPAPRLPAFASPLETHAVELTLPTQEAAVAMVGELAQDELFIKHVENLMIKDNQLSLSNLANGHYWLRLRAVDQHGLQGMESRMRFEVAVPEPRMALVKVYVKSSTVEFRWLGRGSFQRYQIQMSKYANFDTPTLDEESSEHSMEIARPASGQYLLRVRQIDSERRADPWDAPVAFEVR